MFSRKKQINTITSRRSPLINLRQQQQAVRGLCLQVCRSAVRPCVVSPSVNTYSRDAISPSGGMSMKFGTSYRCWKSLQGQKSKVKVIARSQFFCLTREWEHWNLAQSFTIWMGMGIAEKVFQVKGQRSRSQQDYMHFCGGDIHFDGVITRFTCFRYFSRRPAAPRPYNRNLWLLTLQTFSETATHI